MDHLLNLRLDLHNTTLALEASTAKAIHWETRFQNLSHDMDGTLSALDKVTQERDMDREELRVLRAKNVGYMMRMGIARRIAEQQQEDDREIIATAYKANPYAFED